MDFKVSSAKWRPFCLSLNVLKLHQIWLNPSGAEIDIFWNNQVIAMVADALACVAKSSTKMKLTKLQE